MLRDLQNLCGSTLTKLKQTKTPVVAHKKEAHKKFNSKVSLVLKSTVLSLSVSNKLCKKLKFMHKLTN